MIGIIPDAIVTDNLVEEVTVDEDFAVADVERDILKMAVIERHLASGNVGLGFVKGLGLQARCAGLFCGPRLAQRDRYRHERCGHARCRARGRTHARRAGRGGGGQVLAALPSAHRRPDVRPPLRGGQRAA